MGSTDDERILWCGNLSEKVTEELLYELFLQAGPLEKVRIPMDREGRQNSYAFITFKHAVSVPYATQLLNGVNLFDRKLNLKPRSTSQQRQNVMHQPMHVPQNIPLALFVNNINNYLGGVLANKNYPDGQNYDQRHASGRRDRNYNHHKEDHRRSDKPYGQNYRDRNQRNFYSNSRQRH